MTLQSFGSRLREARTAAGLTTRNVASELKDAGHTISHVTISKYERDEFSPTHDTLVALARLFGRSIEWFDGTTSELSGLRFRALKTKPRREKQALAAKSTPWLRLYVYLHQLLDCKPPRDRQVAVKRSETAVSAARKIRKAYGFGDYPIPSISRLLENVNVRVIRMPAPSGIDAFAGVLGTSRVVVVNDALPADRMRLTLAHELAHILFLDCSQSRSASDSDIEDRAFAFASHLLMPTKILKEALRIRSMVRLVQYKERYGISLAAMVYRAQRQSIIPESTSRMLWREFSRLGWRREEPGSVPTDNPIRMEALIDSALRRKKATLNQLSRIAGVGTEEITNRVLSAMGAKELIRGGVDSWSFPISAYKGVGHSTEYDDADE